MALTDQSNLLHDRREMFDDDLVFYPDRRLGSVAKPVSTFDSALDERVASLVRTLQRVAAVGLAGPHVGLLERIVVLQMEPGSALQIYVNPIITWASAERVTQDEGSVSMPGIREGVERAAIIRLTFRDVDGAEHEAASEGFEAACLQHEVDQLDGIFWIERLSRLRRDRARKRFAKLQREAG